MRYHFKPTSYPRAGEERIKTAFLFFPVCIDEEIRWLETATWKEMYFMGNMYVSGRWERLEWVDE